MTPPVAMTPELEAAWAAAIALATERHHAEVGEEHMLAALLFDSHIERLVIERGDLEKLTKLLDERLAPVESYRLGRTLPGVRPSLARTLAAAARGPLGLRSALGLRVSTQLLFDALLARADPEIARLAFAAPRERAGAERDELSVFLDRDPRIGSDRLIEWTMLFGVSRARATFVVHTAQAKGAALAARLPREEAERAYANVMELAAAATIVTPFTLLARDISGIASSLRDLGMDTRAVIAAAQDIALARGDAVITVAHLALALVAEPPVEHALAASSVDVTSLHSSFADMLARTSGDDMAVTHAPLLGDDVEVVLETAKIHAQDRVRLPQLFVALFTHREARILLEAHGARRRSLLLAFLGNPGSDEDVADDEEVGVVFHNDDYTTQEMVVAILVRAFDLGPQKAVKRMLKVHFEGEAQIGVFQAADARLRIAHGLGMARDADMPLRITMRRHRR